MPNRRGFLGMLSTAPLAARAAVENAASSLSGISRIGHVVDQNPIGAPPLVGQRSVGGVPSYELYRKALLNPLLRSQLVDMLYEQERYVRFIDPDLAVLKSFSLNAKITFQRQRNVERRIKEVQQDYSYDRLMKLITGEQ